MTRPRLHSNRGLVPVHQYLFPPAPSWGCWDDGSPGCFPQPSLHLSVLPIPMAQVKSLRAQGSSGLPDFHKIGAITETLSQGLHGAERSRLSQSGHIFPSFILDRKIGCIKYVNPLHLKIVTSIIYPSFITELILNDKLAYICTE